MTPIAPNEASLSSALIAAHFRTDGSDLCVGEHSLRHLAAVYRTPLYVYDAAVVRDAHRALRAAVAGFADVFYSIKANPNPAIVRLLVNEGAGLEVASGAEILVALSTGCAANNIVFAGPAKTTEELECAITCGLGEIHLETFEEIARTGRVADALGKRVSVAIRLNPDASAEGGAMRMGGRATGFGFDEEQLQDVLAAVARYPRLDLIGLHVYAGTQILSAAVLLMQWQHALTLAESMAQRIGRPIQTIDLGGGLGVPYHNAERPLDLKALAQGVPALRAYVAAHPYLRSARILIEPGRYLTASSGIYVATVQAVKTSRDVRFIVTDGGMHHHLAASGNLGQVIKRDYPIVAATKLDASPRTPAQVIGPLCTPLDTFGRQTAMPNVVEGDLIAILQSGAYGLSASPSGFLSHPMPAEVLVDGSMHRSIRPRGTFAAPVTTPSQTKFDGSNYDQRPCFVQQTTPKH